MVVFDLHLKGTASNAAHPNEDNPLMKLPKLIQEVDALNFEKVSPLLGPVKATLTQIQAGSQHNVVPSEVNLVLDVRVNECY